MSHQSLVHHSGVWHSVLVVEDYFRLCLRLAALALVYMNLLCLAELQNFQEIVFCFK